MSSLKNAMVTYKNLSETVKSGIWFTICGFLQRGITMITTPFFTRILSEEQYGIISTFSAWLLIVNLIVTLTIYRSLMNLYVKYEDKEGVLSAVCSLSLVMVILWFLFSIVFGEQLAIVFGLSRTLTKYLFIYSIGETIIQCWLVYKRYIYDYKKAVIITLLLTFVSSVGGIFCILVYGKTAEARLFPQISIYLIIGLLLYINIIKSGKIFYQKSIWKFSLCFCIGLLPHYLSEFVLQSTDKIMINYMCGNEDVAFYSVAYSLGTIIGILFNAINSSFVPYQYKKIKEKEFFELEKTTNTILTGLAIVLVILMFFCKEIVLVFAGYKYLESAEVVIPILLGVFFNYIFQLFARVQEYYNKKLTIVIPSIMCAILNLLLNYFFIKLYGYKAASYTTYISFSLFSLIHYWFYKKVCKEKNIEKIYNGKYILFISVVISILGVVIRWINKIGIIKYIILLLFSLFIYCDRRRVLKKIKEIVALK